MKLSDVLSYSVGNGYNSNPPGSNYSLGKLFDHNNDAPLQHPCILFGN